jgi:hypothetical protein
MDRYEARMNLHGTTQRERVKNRLINHLNDRTKHNLSYKDILLNGKESQLIINSGTQTYYKEFQSLPSQEINVGDYIEWANSFWIVTTCDYDDELYRDGKLEQCNYLLKWQNELGEIIERWAIIKSASKYNDGTDSNAVLSLGSDQLSIIIPIDEESIKLKKSMSKKFFIDGNKEDPTAYELTGTGNVPDTYNGHGITSWIVKECAYTASEDDLKYGVCNYKEVDTALTPPQNPNETGVLRADIKGNSNLKVGFERTYTATITDVDGNVVQWDNLYSWNVVSDFEVSKEFDKNTIKLLIENEDHIDGLILLSVNHNGQILTEIEITVIDNF